MKTSFADSFVFLLVLYQKLMHWLNFKIPDVEQLFTDIYHNHRIEISTKPNTKEYILFQSVSLKRSEVFF